MSNTCIEIAMSDTIKSLETIFDKLNTRYFESKLPHPVITVQSTPKAYGHCSVKKICKDETSEGQYEINIGAEYINRPTANTCATLLHEMVHLYCRENGIKEVSRGGKYHNKRFKAEAERRGLVCVPCGQYGWNTTPSDNLVEYALSKGWNEIKIGRGSLPPIIRTGASGTAQTGAETTGGGKRPSSTRKLQCPKCGCSVRATKTVRIMCMDCMEQMIEV